MQMYTELLTKSFYSFGEGASYTHEILARAKDLGYPALALTDTNLCGAHEFAMSARQYGIKPITGGQFTLEDDSRIVLLARSRVGYANLSRLFTNANAYDRKTPKISSDELANRAEGLTIITGCNDSLLSNLVVDNHTLEAENLLKHYLLSFGNDAVFIGLHQNRVYGDTARNRKLTELGRRMSIPLVATNNVVYHSPARHRLQNVLTAIRLNSTLDEAIHKIKPSPEFYLKSPNQMARIFKENPDAIKNTLRITESCQFNLACDLGYKLPIPPVPEGYTPDTYLERLCYESGQRRYGYIPKEVSIRLHEELRLIHKHGLSGFLLLYHEIATIAHHIMVEEGLTPAETSIELRSPGRSRGSSVALLVGYLIGISHVDPMAYDLTLERFLPEDMQTLPDIDLDFPRGLREKLIHRIHQRFGKDHAVLVGAITTYRIKGLIANIGKALGLPGDSLRRLSDGLHSHDAINLKSEMERLPDFVDKVNAPGWRDLIDLAPQLEGAPKGLGQHVGGFILSSSPIPEIAPVREGAIDGRYIMDWDKDTIANAGLAKIDILSLPVLDQIHDAISMVEEKTGSRPDLSNIGANDPNVYNMINEGKTIGVFLLQSPAQLKMGQRLRSRNLKDLAYQVALIRPGVGMHGSTVNDFIARYRNKILWDYDHPLEQRALERGYGIIIWQEQVVQLISDVGGMSTAEADDVRRAFTKGNKSYLLSMYKIRFMEGATKQSVPSKTAEKIWSKINGHYMFPESHSYAFGINAYQSAWLKRYYPVEFFTALFNNFPMGFYPKEVIKQDARRFGVPFLNPCINTSQINCISIDGNVLLGLRFVKNVGISLAGSIIKERERNGIFASILDFSRRLQIDQLAMRCLILVGAFDALEPNRRLALWEAGLHDSPRKLQLPLSFSQYCDIPYLADFSDYQKALAEYSVLSVYPRGHLMEFLRPRLKGVHTTLEIDKSEDGESVTVAGWITTRQHPRGEGGVIFITIEDEYFYTQLILWPNVFQKYMDALKNHVIRASGKISKWDGTPSVIVSSIEPIKLYADLPKSHEWH